MRHRLPTENSIKQRASFSVGNWTIQVRKVGTGLLWLALLGLGVGYLSSSKLSPRSGWWPAQRVHAQGNSSFTFTDFDAKDAGTGMLQGTIGTSINDNGDIAGIYLNTNGTATNVAHGFVRTANGTITEFDSPHAGTGKNQGTFPTGINANGEITGMYFDANNGYHGFLRSAAGAITEFDVPGAPTSVGHRGTLPIGINSGGDIAGFWVDSTNDVRHGFVRTAAGTFSSFDAPGASLASTWGTVPFSINAAGTVTGYYNGAGGTAHGFLRAANGTITAPLDAPGAGTGWGKLAGGGTIPTSINTAGDIAGVYGKTGSYHGFVYTASSATPAFTTFDAPNMVLSGLFMGTVAASMNAGGAVSGDYTDAQGDHHGFVRAADGTFTSPVDDPNSVYTTAFSGTILISINATGQMTGTYQDANFVFHAFLAVPAQGTATATPTFSPAAGTYTSAQSVTISDTTSGAAIYYTTDGSTPTTSSTTYTAPIAVTSTETIKAIAAGSGLSNSAVASATYTITLPAAATPTFSPVAGTYTSAQTVAISDTTAGASIYYTTDGSTPTTASLAYSTPIAVNATETLKAIAAAPGYSNSAVGSAAYTINLPTPDFQISVSPSSLTIRQGQSGTATFTVTPTNGFNSPVSFGCTGLPAKASCTFNPASVTPNGSAVTTTLTVSTTANSMVVRAPQPFSPGPVCAGILLVCTLLFGLVTHQGRAQLRLRFLTLLLLVLVASGLSSCTGGNSSSGSNTGTPIGTTALSVSATASAGRSVSHSATLTVTVTP